LEELKAVLFCRGWGQILKGVLVFQALLKFLIHKRDLKLFKIRQRLATFVIAKVYRTRIKKLKVLRRQNDAILSAQ
jgi:hypothetical protein